MAKDSLTAAAIVETRSSTFKNMAIEYTDALYLFLIFHKEVQEFNVSCTIWCWAKVLCPA